MCIILYLHITYNIYNWEGGGVWWWWGGGGHAGTACIADLKGDNCLSNKTLLDKTKKYCKQIAPSLYLPVNNNGIGFIFSFK